MFELEINGTMHPVRFGMGFLRDINKSVKVPVKDVPGVSKEIGLSWYVALIAEGDVEALAEVIMLGNKTENPRIKRSELDSWIEDESTDIDSVFKQVMDFLERSNVTKKTTVQVNQAIEAELEKQQK